MRHTENPLTVERMAISEILESEANRRDRSGAYDRAKFRGIRDTIPRNFVTQLLFPEKFTSVSPVARGKQVGSGREAGGKRARKRLGKCATDIAHLCFSPPPIPFSLSSFEFKHKINTSRSTSDRTIRWNLIDPMQFYRGNYHHLVILVEVYRNATIELFLIK